MIRFSIRKIWSVKECTYINKSLKIWFGLEFNGPVITAEVMSSWSVYHTLPGQVKSFKQLTSNCSHSFARKWQLSFLNQWKGENDSRKYFMINLHERTLPDPVWIKPPDTSHTSVSFKYVNNLCYILVISSTLQLTCNLWYITQQITTRAVLFLFLK